MKNILIIGGNRNMGQALMRHLAEEGYRVTVLNRGIEGEDLPEGVAHLRADRTDPQQMRRALLGKHFDVVLDFVMYNGREAEVALELLRDRIQHYIFLSSGQVYLVREDIQRPYREDQYEGRLVPPPKENTYAYEEWRYGMDKRGAEDRFAQAHADYGFPCTVLRLPMVNSERDPFRRLYNYILRLKDGGPILVPETPSYSLRHIYSGDVVRVLRQLVDSGQGIGQAYNLSQDETVTIDEFLDILAGQLGTTARVVRVKMSLLEAGGFLPDCSPFSDRWMSELDNTRSKAELGVQYTPLREYLARLVAHYDETKPQRPVGYKRRQAEIMLAREVKEA